MERNNATAFQFPHCAYFFFFSFLKGTCFDAHRGSLKLFHDAVIFFSMTRHVTAHATRCNIVAGRQATRDDRSRTHANPDSLWHTPVLSQARRGGTDGLEPGKRAMPPLSLSLFPPLSFYKVTTRRKGETRGENEKGRTYKFHGIPTNWSTLVRKAKDFFSPFDTLFVFVYIFLSIWFFYWLIVH